MSYRKKRSTKTLSYTEPETLSDDDFVCSSPPMKRSKTKCNKGKNLTRTCEKESSASKPHVDKCRKPCRKNPKERVLVDDQKYEEELRAALALSAQEVKNEVLDEFVIPRENSIPPVTTYTLKADVHSPPNDISQKTETEMEKEDFNGFSTYSIITSETKLVNEISVAETDKLVNESFTIVQHFENSVDKKEEKIVEVFVDSKNGGKENVSSIVNSNEIYNSKANGKRAKKKVNFVEDDFENWSESDENSDDSDCYEPSPPKKKKKVTRPPPSKSPKINNSKPPIRKVTNSNKSNPSCDILKTSKNIVHESASSCILPTIKSQDSSHCNNSIQSPNPSTGILCTKPGFSIVKTPFKCPTIHSGSPTNSTPRPSTGLRLGLSRKSVTKPLHPYIVR